MTIQAKKGGYSWVTVKDKDLYVICTKIPAGSISVPSVGSPSKVSMPGFDGQVKYSKKGNGIVIAFPVLSPSTNPSPHAWTFKITNAFL